ncbi:MAG: LrgB family protein [Propionibacteriaceae bacterium]|jgi:predicted murein hydrolase (TIGR00659 family)|nr:LrgB family protein [Propionibacteriaceae bacterium]
MNEFLESLDTFGITLTLLVYIAASWLRSKVHHPLVNPMLITVVVLIATLALSGTSFASYNNSASILSFMLTPVTVCLAVPLYLQLQELRRNVWAILAGICTGTLAGLSVTLLYAKLVGLSVTEFATLLPRSITTPMGLGASEKIGGIATVTVAIIVLTGIWGNLVGRTFLRLIRVREPIARGVALGTSSHGMGTTLAFELGQVEGAMSSLSIAITGVITVALLPIFLRFM